MSLLMDALRKAEESKKQAEKGQDSNEVNIDESSSTPPVVKEDKVVPVTAPIPDVTVEFVKEDTPPQEFKETEAESGNNSLAGFEEAIESASIALEPRSEPPIESTSDFSDARQVNEVSVDFVPIQSATEDLQVNLDDEETPETAAEVDQEKAIYSIDMDEQSQSKASSSGLGVDVPHLESEASAVTGSNLEMAPDEKEYVRPKPVVSEPPQSISKSTEKSRVSAKTVFAAKKTPLKNKRAQLISAVGVALLLVLALGFYFLLPSDSNSGIIIPDSGYSVASSASMSDFETTNTGSIETFVEEAGDLDLSGNENLGSSTAIVEGINNQNSNAVIADETPIATEVQTAAAEPSSIDSNEITLENLSSAQTVQNQVSVAPEASADQLVETTELESSEAVMPAIAPTSVAAELEDDSGFNVAATVSEQMEVESQLISFEKTQTSSQIPPGLSRAYALYSQGNYDEASRLYEDVLEITPQNIDALLGVAAIASSRSQVPLAMRAYSLVLSLDPSHAVARSGLLSLVPNGSAADQERELKKLYSEHPNVAAVIFSLANFYASQSRWTDAQQYYFDALQLAKRDSFVGTPVSPDYAFNLAVSLERLNQPLVALSFYEEALELATQNRSAFDPIVARQRLERIRGLNAQ